LKDESLRDARGEEETKETPMQALTVDFIMSLDGYGAAEGWPGW
jgi:hypothetical protein